MVSNVALKGVRIKVTTIAYKRKNRERKEKKMSHTAIYFHYSKDNLKSTTLKYHSQWIF